MLIQFLYQNSNGMMVFGKIDETSAILIFAVFLIALTIGIRWFFKKHDNKTSSKSGENEVLR